MTAEKNQNPSIDPADNYSLSGSIQFAYKKMMQSTDGMLPAKVIAYDRTTNRAQVQILINLLTTDGTQVNRAQIASIPVLLFGGGNFFVSFPILPGNMGWVIANDRDISLFLNGYAQSKPNTNRIKSFSDSLFIPDAMTGYTISGDDDENMVIQNLDGTIKISVGVASITVEHPTLINIKAPSISIDLGLPTNNLNVNGSIVATGTITP